MQVCKQNCAVIQHDESKPNHAIIPKFETRYKSITNHQSVCLCWKMFL